MPPVVESPQPDASRMRTESERIGPWYASVAENGEITRFGVVDDQRARRLLGHELELFRQRHADALGRQEREHLRLLFEARAGGIAEAVARALIGLIEQ